MADQVYLIPGGGLYKDTEQGHVVLIPGGGLYKETEAIAVGTTVGTLINKGLINNSLTGGRLVA